MNDLIRRQAAIDAINKKRDSVFHDSVHYEDAVYDISNLPTAQPEEVTPHQNYKYLSDYWCECGGHLGKKGEVKYCSECGRKVNWDG